MNEQLNIVWMAGYLASFCFGTWYCPLYPFSKLHWLKTKNSTRFKSQNLVLFFIKMIKLKGSFQILPIKIISISKFPIVMVRYDGYLSFTTVAGRF
jgi:hypothetical protein